MGMQMGVHGMLQMLFLLASVFNEFVLFQTSGATLLHAALWFSAALREDKWRKSM